MATEVRFTSAPRKTLAHRVFTAATWADEWEEVEGLHCDYCAFTSNPEMARAQFTWLACRLKRPGGDWQTVERLDNLRSYVKVEIDWDNEGDIETLKWYGILEDDHRDQSPGKQTLVAYGLDILLQRHILRSSMAFDSSAAEIKISRAIEFNAKAHFHGQGKIETGNRSEDSGSEGAYLFAHDMAGAEYWSTFEALAYLLNYEAPPNQLDNVEIPWNLGSLDELPDWDRPRVACHGRTLRQVFDHLLNRSRLLGYTIEVNEDDDPNIIQLVPFTFTPQDINFAEDDLIDNLIPANANQKNLIFDRDSGVSLAVVKRSTLEQMDQVVCTGDRVVACFSLQPPSSTLEKGWTDQQQAAYEAAATGLAGYASLDGSDQEAYDKHARSSAAAKRVYAYYNIPADWDGYLDVAAGGNLYTGMYFEDPLNEGVPLPHYWPQMRLLSHLPLKTDHDYSVDAIEADAVTDDTPEGQKWEYLPALAAIQIPESDPGRFKLLNVLSINSEYTVVADTLDDGLKWSAGLRMQDDAPGVVLTVQGAPQHVLGLNDFTGLDEFEQEEAIFDWDTLTITVAMEVDLFAEGVWPDADELPASEVTRRLIVELGDEYKCHYVAKGTMVDVDSADGSLRVTTTGGFIRDDRPRLRSLARLVFQWYGIQRQSLELSFEYVTGKLSVGDLLTTVGEGDSLEEINSVVTAVKYEFSFREGTAPGVAKTTITTDFAELDAKGFSNLFNA